MRRSSKSASRLKECEACMKLAFQNAELKKISKYQNQMRDSLKLASDLTRRKNCKKFASEIPTLRNILSIEFEI